ncbi:thioredoxin [Pyrrhoderma noxium]|uniref:Thioredoxin n=1 Tax=Pyrrhoderma noxium TaxID=2282107 RepID=A0A286UEQ3_9AGAM|nr:thioredoxin [Pyrrhoderma noxium]
MSNETDATMKLKIDVISDSICPFCYIGKRKLDRAIDIAKEKGLKLEFDVQFHPFLLDPTLTEDNPVNKRSRYAEKFGKERSVTLEKMMIERGKQSGINFSYGGDVRQTTKSHRLIALAYEKGGQDMQKNIIERLFNGYFEREQDIGDIDFLSTQASDVGLFPTSDDAKIWLESDEKKEEVQTAIQRAQMMGVSGVPFFILNNKYAISGAEESELFVEVFERFCGKQNTRSNRIPSDLVCT